jgi:hypothetical protein
MRLFIACGLIGVIFSLLGYPVLNVDSTIEYKNSIALLLSIIVANLLHKN